MGQGIYRYRGMDSWEEAQEVLPNAEEKLLRTSYRSTVEIMNYANGIALRHPYPGQVLAEPILRHGETPREVVCLSRAEQEEAIAEAAQSYQAEGMHSIAILARDERSAKALHQALRNRGLDCRLLDPYGDDYQGGTLVAAATAVKGLEFDAVIVEDANAYPDDPTGTRLLYVCVTRALHAVTLVLHVESHP
jgi:DNA helicase-2/ATP-dependent DNA helicase PcrA